MLTYDYTDVAYDAPHIYTEKIMTDNILQFLWDQLWDLYKHHITITYHVYAADDLISKKYSLYILFLESMQRKQIEQCYLIHPKWGKVGWTDHN